jgi:hypothetical protein
MCIWPFSLVDQNVLHLFYASWESLHHLSCYFDLQYKIICLYYLHKYMCIWLLIDFEKVLNWSFLHFCCNLSNLSTAKKIIQLAYELWYFMNKIHMMKVKKEEMSFVCVYWKVHRHIILFGIKANIMMLKNIITTNQKQLFKK